MARTDNIGHPQVKAILDHLARYRLSVFSVIKRLPVFSGCGPKDVKRTLHSCKRDGLIGSAPLAKRAHYWYLESCGSERLGLPEGRAGPLSEPAKIRALSMLRFCWLSDRPRQLLTADELAERFPMLLGIGPVYGYYFDPHSTGRIGLLRIDAGRRGRWDRVLQTVRQDIKRHLQHRGFYRIIRADRFEMTVITVLPQKAQRIRESLPSIAGTDQVPVVVVAMPELLPLIAPGR